MTVGNTDPYITDPASTDELWVDTALGAPGILKARVGGMWQELLRYSTSVNTEYTYGTDPFAGSQNTVSRGDHTHGTPPEEVVIGDTDPAVANPDVDFWYDTTSSKLMIRVGNTWVEYERGVTPPPIPDEVLISSSPPRDVTTELWYDPDAIMPPLTDEVWIGPDEPILFPEVELWFDTDDTSIGSGGDEVHIGPDDPDTLVPNGIELWYDTDAVAAADVRTLVHAHHFIGPVPTSAASTWTVTLATGIYLCQFGMSAVASVTGIRFINLDMEGMTVTPKINVGQSKFWFNAAGVHQMMNTGVSVIDIPATGAYTFTLSLGASTTADVNDFGYIVLTPAAPGAVS